MSRHFAETIPAVGATLRLSPAEKRHMEKVLRLKDGDRIELFDGRGLVAVGRICAHPDGGSGVEITDLKSENGALGESPVWIVCALARGERERFIVEKATELGVDRIIFFEAARSTRKVSENAVSKLQRFAREAAKQSTRTVLPEILVADSLVGAMAQIPESAHGYFFTQKAERSLDIPSPIEKRDVFTGLVGPEGGFTAEEEDLAIGRGFQPVSLGLNVLRTDTAALAGIVWLKIMSRPHLPR
jgi:16S rRNA (uracil1498-N3)-methyltransferase